MSRRRSLRRRESFLRRLGWAARGFRRVWVKPLRSKGSGATAAPPPLLRSRGSDGSRDGLPDPVQVLLGQEDVDARLPRVPTLPKGSDAPEDALADQRTAGVTLQPEVTVRMWGLSQGTHSSFHSFICSHTFSLPHFKATLKVQTHSQRGRGGGGAEAD